MAPAPSISKILLSVDVTEEGLQAARYAVALAKTLDAELYALYVVNEQLVEDLVRAHVFITQEGLDMRRDLEQDGLRYLKAAERLAAAKGVPIVTELRKGIVHLEVVERARQIGAGIIVVGGFDEPVTRRALFHNETERILWTASCPVLVVRGDETVQRVYDAL